MVKPLEKIVDFAVRVSTEKLVDFAVYASSVAVSISSKAYSGPYWQYVDGYVHDLALPISFNFTNRIFGVYDGRKLKSAAAILALCFATEVAQAVGICPGKYDQNDFLAYAAGAGLALGLDTILERMIRRKRAATPNGLPEQDAKPQAMMG